jgi:Cu(I)/Ag(I) efflux system membrane fusion protein
MTAPSRKYARRWMSTLVFAATLIIAGLVFRRSLRAWFAGEDGSIADDAVARAVATSAQAGGGQPAGPDEVHHYTCSMHPSVKQQTPGKCPICGMDLTVVTNAQHDQGVVMVDETRRQLIGVRIESVIEAPLQRTFRALGRVTYDESGLADVTSRVRGWITALLVNQTGQRIQRGQPMFRVYSPELYGAEQDFLLTNRGGTARGSGPNGAAGHMESLGRAARQRLHLLGMTEAQVDELAQRGVPSESVEFSSPMTGFVIEKNVVQGAAVEAGMRLYRIAALDEVWVEADVYEADLPHVRVGQPATVTLDYLPGRAYSAKVAYIYPAVDPMARTGRVRLVLRNQRLELRPGMYASVTLALEVGPRVQVPASAVVFTGPRRLVFVDIGEGRFRPQEVRLGAEANGKYEVFSGLTAGDRVATSGVFLIAAEARITTAATYWDKPAAPVDAPASTEPASRPPTNTAPASRPPASTAPASRPPAPVFMCPMHPEVRGDAPGKCGKCGMDLVRTAPVESQ